MRSTRHIRYAPPGGLVLLGAITSVAQGYLSKGLAGIANVVDGCIVGPRFGEVPVGVKKAYTNIPTRSLEVSQEAAYTLSSYMRRAGFEPTITYVSGFTIRRFTTQPSSLDWPDLSQKVRFSYGFLTPR
jgi:hypothetical protein